MHGMIYDIDLGTSVPSLLFNIMVEVSSLFIVQETKEAKLGGNLRHCTCI